MEKSCTFFFFAHKAHFPVASKTESEFKYYPDQTYTRPLLWKPFILLN